MLHASPLALLINNPSIVEFGRHSVRHPTYLWGPSTPAALCCGLNGGVVKVCQQQASTTARERQSSSLSNALGGPCDDDDLACKHLGVVVLVGCGGLELQLLWLELLLQNGQAALLWRCCC